MRLKLSPQFLCVWTLEPYELLVLTGCSRNSSPKNNNFLKMCLSSGIPRCRWVWFFIRTIIHNIAFSYEKFVSSESGEKYAQIKHRLQAKTVLNMWLDFDVRGFWCNAAFLQICSHEETNSSSSWMAWGWVHFQHLEQPLITNSYIM